MNRNRIPTNRNACIQTRRDRSGKLRTETARRDDSALAFAVSTNPRSNTTALFIDAASGESVQLTGAAARTLYRLLRKHYKFSGKAR